MAHTGRGKTGDWPRADREDDPFARDVTESTYGDLDPAERVALVFLLRKMMGM